MKKLKTFLIVFLLAPIIAGVYGILHDQITCTISPEYYTKLKFHQFGLITMNTVPPLDRLLVSVVGFGATWWVGIPIGIILGLIGLRSNLRNTFRALGLTLIITLIIGFVGGGTVYSLFVEVPNEYLSRYYYPITDIDRYFLTGSIHNFSYIGGVLGLVISSIWLWRKKG